MNAARFHCPPRRNRFTAVLAGILIAGIAIGAGYEEFAGKGTFKVRVGSKSVLGRPVEYNDHQLIMLRRDGRMLQYRMNEIDELSRVSNYFEPYSPLKLQSHFRKKFGDQYEVSRTRHYVVVHPRGMRRQWADPFDELYNRFSYYFSVRQFTMRPAEFPMVVIVFNSRSEFNRVAASDGMPNPDSYAGYYSPTSNWIVTYRGSSPWGDENWEKNDTLIHEALHQFAFNRGIHERYAPTPKWCAEGLASMFEQRGINNNRQFRFEKDRLNERYVQVLKGLVGQNAYRGLLKNMIASDRLFTENIGVSYSLSWGLSYYLAETRPAEFNRYLQRVAKRKRLENYTSSDRLADFAASFGTDFTMLESHLANYFQSL